VRGPSELVGELAALDEKLRSASIVALEPVDAVAVPLCDFRSFLRERPTAALSLLVEVSRRLRDADAKRIDYAGWGTLERVGARLMEMCERFRRCARWAGSRRAAGASACSIRMRCAAAPPPTSFEGRVIGDCSSSPASASRAARSCAATSARSGASGTRWSAIR
jgi:CRP-like cAMP-binding protein